MVRKKYSLVIMKGKFLRTLLKDSVKLLVSTLFRNVDVCETRAVVTNNTTISTHVLFFKEVRYTYTFV